VTRRSLPPAIGLLLAFGLLIPGAAYAQGNGRPKAPKAPTPTTTTPSSSTSASTSTPTSTSAPTADVVAGATSSFRQFGSWLDDASSSYKGDSYASLGVGYWRLAESSQVNAPMLGMGWGVSDRLQVSASVPFYHTTYAGATSSGMDDLYFGAKYTLIDPTLTLSEFGLAVNPIVEVLSAGNPDGRVHFALPVNVELRRQPFRMYGSAGYFTRGSVFGGGALEWTSARMILTGSLTQRRAGRAPQFVGRERELEQLAARIHDATPGGRLVLVTGPSGVGKTALIEEALGRMRDGDTIAWRGRCHERELVPYRKRLDPSPAVRPDWPGWEKELARAVDEGALAVRAYPVHWGLGVEHPAMIDLGRACADRQLAVLLTVRFEDARQRHVIDVAGDLPAATIRAIARAGTGARIVVVAAGRALIEEVHWGLTPAERELVWYDTSWIWGPPERDFEHILRTIGATRFVYGTGWPLRLAQVTRANLALLPPDLVGARLTDPTTWQVT